MVVIIAVFILGYGGLKNMTPDLLPDIDLPYVLVITSYPGATPEKVETSVTKPLENQMASLENLKSISSESSDNVSMVFLEFSGDANLDAITIDILQKVNMVEGAFDDIVGTPIILKMNPEMLPIMVSAVEMDGKDTAALSRFTEETLRTKLEGIEGVAAVSISGLVEKQVNAVIDPAKVDAANERVAVAIGAELDEKSAELRDSKAELQSKLDDVEESNQELKDGVGEFAGKIADGRAEIGTNSTMLSEGKQALTGQMGQVGTQLEQMLGRLAQLQAQLELGAALAPEEMAELTGLPIGIEQAQGGLAMMQEKMKELEDGAAKLAEAQQQLDSVAITTQYDMAAGAAQIAAAQMQLNAAIEQIKSGLESLDEAREDAIAQADLHSVLTMDMISQMLMAENFSMPAGYVHDGNTDLLVRVGDEVGSLSELGDLVILDPDMDDVLPIRLTEVADVFISDNLDSLYAKINGTDGLVLTFQRQSDYATAAVSDSIKAKFDDLSKAYPGLKFTPLMDQGDYIYVVINSIAENLLFGAIFAILILFLFLRDIRPTFITLCSIPISVVFAIVLMYFSGVTLNIISLSGLAVAVGMLVDNSIVVIENIFRLRAKGFSAARAAITGASQVGGAITASTLTTICVFVPIVFIQGITRKMFTDMALTLAYSLLASLVIAMTLVPAMASGLFKNMKAKPDKTLDRVQHAYGKALGWALRFKPVVLILVVLLLGGSAAAVLARGFSYMPSGDMPQLTIEVTPPDGTDFAGLKKTTDDVATRVMQIPGVETVGAITSDAMGSIMGLGMLDGGGAAEASTVYVIVDEEAGGKNVRDLIREAVSDIDADIDIQSMSMMDTSGLGGSGVSINLYSDNMDDLLAAAAAVSAAAIDVPGVASVSNGLEDATPELRFAVDKAKAMAKGLTVYQVYQEVSKALTEERTAVSVTFNNDAYDVVVVQASPEELTPDFVKNLKFTVTDREGDKQTVALSDIATVENAESLPSINRVDQRQYLAVAVAIGEDENVTLMAGAIDAKVAQLSLPGSVSYELAGESTTIMDAVGDLGWMLILGIALVYLVMVAQFQSLKNPFIIMFTIPLAFTGGFLALLITGMELSVVSLVGFVMLVGVIVNNAIVLVDFINRLRLEGAEKRDAIIEAGKTRMRPILMTAMTTILGLLMMAVGFGTGSEMMQPLAVVCIGGLAYATLMTLFVVPIIYDAFNKKGLRKIDEADLAIDLEA